MPDSGIAVGSAPWSRYAVALVIIVGLLLTTTAYVLLRRAEEQRLMQALNVEVDWRTMDLEAKVRLAGQVLVATVSDVEAEPQPQVQAGQFQLFTNTVIAHSPSLASIVWAQPVGRAQRASFEATAGFPILENGADGRRVVAGAREEYVPITVQNSFDRLPLALGVDLAADPVRRRALQMARDTGLPRSVQIPEGSGRSGPTYLIFWPTYRRAGTPLTVDQRRVRLKGYVVGVFRLLDVLRTAMTGTPAAVETIDFYLGNEPEGVAAPVTLSHMATYSPEHHAIEPAGPSRMPPAADHSFTRSFRVNGQVWQLVCSFSPATLAARRSLGPLVILVAGLLLTALVALNLMHGRRSVSSIRQIVRSQTAQLTKTNEQLNALIDASPYAIVCIDAQRRVILWNASAEQLFGYAADEVIGHPYPLVLPEESQEFDRRFERLAAGEILRNMASHRRHRDGTVIDTSSSASAFFDANGRMAGAVFAIEDARERNEVQNQLRQAQKMEAIGQLTGGLAHDFNNLLGVILGNLDLLAERFQAGSEDWQLTDAAIQAAMRGAELIRRLLAFSRRQPLAPKLAHLPPLLESISALLRRTLGEHIRLVQHFQAATWPVLIDTSQLESTMLNLAVNARDAMPDGGRLTIEASNVVIDERASQLNLEATPGDYVVIAVSDTGVGMTEEILAHVFEPFFTTKGNSGTGLGLSMVHGFIKQSGGYSKIYSEPGHGTTVRLYLPRAKLTEVTEADTVQIELLPHGEEVILVVEDNASIRGVVVRQLETLGYHTLLAGSGDEALEIISGGAAVDLLFTDVVMPGALDGRALAKAARRLRPALQVLFTSGFTAAAAAGENDLGSNLLSKPYRKSELARRIRAALDAAE